MNQAPFPALGKYEVLEILGQGGFGTVYKAHDTTLDVDVAIKVLDPLKSGDADTVQRFLQEARITARLNHPHIVSLFETGQVENRYFIAFRYVPGQNLQTLIQERPLLPLDDVAAIIAQVADALDYAHSQGVVHRDVKPSNIIIDDEGHVTLTDFGIVKVLDTVSIKTTTGAILSTPYYASPEQAESKPLDGRSDLYSLGVVAYQLLTGEVPHKADTTPSLYYKIVHEMPPKPSTLNTRVAEPLEEVLLKALAKQPEERYQTCAEFAQALAQAAQHVKGAHIVALYQQTEAQFAAGDLDAAETCLRQILAIDPAHQEAEHLKTQLVSHREWRKQYQALTDVVRQAQAQAQTLRAAYPEAPDPEGILDALVPVELPGSDKRGLTKSTGLQTRLSPGVIQRLELILGLVAIAAAVTVFLLAQQHLGFIDWSRYWIPSSLANTISRGATVNFLRGLGLGLGSMGVLLMAIFFFKTGKTKR